MTYLAEIAQRIYNVPLLITEDKLSVIHSVLERRITIDEAQLIQKAPSADGETAKPSAASYAPGEFELIDPNNPRGPRKPYRTTKAGTAIIPVIGSLVNRGGFLDAMSGVTSYEKIKFQVAAAAADDAVKNILLDIDSPGGEATGAFEASDAVRLAAAVKPVTAMANGLCCSAAYAIASGATRIVASRSSYVGSIGVAILHLDRSAQLKEAGIKPTLITTGKQKASGHPYFELSDDVKGEMRARANKINEIFVSSVVAHRPNLSAETIISFEAGVFLGNEAVEKGLADEVASFESALAEIERGSIGRPTQRGRLTMTTSADATFTQADLDAAVAKARAEGATSANAEATKVANARIATVTSCEHYAGREKTALHLLTSTELSAEQIVGTLATLPAAAPAASTEAPKPSAAAEAPGRSQNSPGGLAVEGAPGATASKENPGGPALSDFEAGKAIAKSFKKSA